MLENYTATVAILCMALIVLGVLVFENGRMDTMTKRRFYHTCSLLILSTLAEWASVFLNGAPEWTRNFHGLVKSMDYIVTPISGVYFASMIWRPTNKRFHLALCVVMAVNALLALISNVTGWLFYLDQENYYHHGPLYFVYAAVYCMTLACVLLSFRAYSREFKRKNKISLYAVIMMVCLGILLQELGGWQIRTTCLSLAFGTILLFIHYSEFSQQRSDDSLSHQKILIETDALTGMSSRYAYTETLREFTRSESLPRDLVVFFIDVNGLKFINDTMGHSAGDELICGAARCITEVLGKYGRAFRTSGDEFVAVTRLDRNQIPQVRHALQTAAESWRGNIVHSLSLSIGYAAAEDHPGLPIDKLVNVADKQMYKSKEAYYQHVGLDRRRTAGACPSDEDA